jgi:HEAT repeat protein
MIHMLAELPRLSSSQENFTVDNDYTVDDLIVKLTDDDQFVRIHAASLLGSMGDEAGAAVPALIALLESGDVHDRRLAALTLGEIGPAAEEAIPALLEAADDEDESVAELALDAVERIDVVEIEDEAA